MALNKVQLIGNLGQNPEVKFTPSGQAVATLSVATNESWTDKQGQKQEKVEWHRVVVWGKTAENCGQYLQKGRQVYVEGKLQTRQWEDKDGQKKYTTEIQAQSVQFLGGTPGGGGERVPHPAEAGAPTSAPAQNGKSPSAPIASAQEFTEDDIPF